MMGKLDIIGDIHGDLAGLQAVGRELGYDVDHGWHHADGRHLVFVGDLVDGGPEGLGVSELVMGLVKGGRATCLMGNHEYNLLEASDLGDVRSSGRDTFEDSNARPERWKPVLSFFRSLPLAIETRDLRLVHAVWDAECIEMVSPLLRREGRLQGFPDEATWWASPFTEHGLLEGLPTAEIPASNDRPHAILMKGLENAASGGAFKDVRGKLRKQTRECWWRESVRSIPRDKLIVFGHYHHIPPIGGEFAPPHSYGTTELAAWAEGFRSQVPSSGRAKVPSDVMAVCVDLDDGRAGHGWVGALRWPEREVVWARGPGG